MSRDVSHKDTNFVLIDRDKVIKITSHGCHWTICGGDAQVFELGIAARKNRVLNLVRNLEFLLDREQAASVGEDLLCGYISK